MAFRLVLINEFFLRLSLRKRGQRSLPERPSLSALCGGKPQSTGFLINQAPGIAGIFSAPCRRSITEEH